MSNLNTNTYAKSFAILKSTGDKLKRGGPADVDTLVETFREAREAYSACRARLMAIKDEIEAEIAAISPTEIPGSEGGGAPAHA